MKTPEIRSLYVLDILFVAYHSHGHSFPLEMFHSSDLEPHASPGLPECERRNPRGECGVVFHCSVSLCMFILSVTPK